MTPIIDGSWVGGGLRPFFVMVRGFGPLLYRLLRSRMGVMVTSSRLQWFRGL